MINAPRHIMPISTIVIIFSRSAICADITGYGSAMVQRMILSPDNPWPRSSPAGASCMQSQNRPKPGRVTLVVSNTALTYAALSVAAIYLILAVHELAYNALCARLSSEACMQACCCAKYVATPYSTSSVQASNRRARYLLLIGLHPL
jgi:hypothetical protein